MPATSPSPPRRKDMRKKVVAARKAKKRALGGLHVALAFATPRLFHISRQASLDGREHPSPPRGADVHGRGREAASPDAASGSRLVRRPAGAASLGQ